MINAEVGVEKRETSYTDGGNVNYYSHWRSMNVPPKRKAELLYDPAIPCLDIYPEKTLI